MTAILVDENIPRMTVEALRLAGHDVEDIRGSSAQGLLDPDLWQLAMAGRRLLITTDKGFTEYRNSDHHGILIVRLRQPNRLKIHRMVIRTLARFADEDWRGLLVVARDSTISLSRSGGQPERSEHS